MFLCSILFMNRKSLHGLWTCCVSMETCSACFCFTLNITKCCFILFFTCFYMPVIIKIWSPANFNMEDSSLSCTSWLPNQSLWSASASLPFLQASLTTDSIIDSFINFLIRVMFLPETSCNPHLPPSPLWFTFYSVHFHTSSSISAGKTFPFTLHVPIVW